MTDNNETKALELMAERAEQRDAAHIDGPAVADALALIARRACCLETLANVVLGELDRGGEGYRLAELLAMDVSSLAVEIEETRDELEATRLGAPNRFAARD